MGIYPPLKLGHRRGHDGPDGSKAVKLKVSICFPVYPQHRTFVSEVGTSVQCQKATYAVQQRAAYSMTSSARASSVGGTLRPRARAVGRFIANTNLADCTTGKSAGFSPLIIRPA